MSRVVCDVKLLESPFPHGSRREQMCFGCWPLQHSSFKFYKVFMGLKVILSNENIIGNIRNGFHGFLKKELGSKIEGIMATLLILRPEHMAKLWSRKIQTMLM